MCDDSPRRVDVLDDSLPVVVFSGGRPLFQTRATVFLWWQKLDPDLVDRWMTSKKHIIGLVELYAVVLARSTWSDRISGRKVIYFIDNIPAMRALIRGTSSDLDWRSVLLSYEDLECEGNRYAWYARVPSKSNIADCPGRNDVGDMVGMECETPRCIFTGKPISGELVKWFILVVQLSSLCHLVMSHLFRICDMSPGPMIKRKCDRLNFIHL